MTKRVAVNGFVLGLMGAIYSVTFIYALTVELNSVSSIVLRAFVHDLVMGSIAVALSFSLGKSIWSRFVIFLAGCLFMSVAESFLVFKSMKLEVGQGLALKVFVDQIRWVIEGLLLVAFSRKPLSTFGLGLGAEVQD